MATERSPHQQWADEQIAQLIELGVNPIDAEKAVRFVLDNLPPGENPETYILPDSVLVQEPSEHMNDAAAAWMAADSVPARFKRILFAKEESE